MNSLLITLVFVVNFFAVPAVSADDDDKQVERTQRVNGQIIITLDEKAQQLSGIETITLKPANYGGEFTAYGKAITIQPLLELRSRYLALLAERNSAIAKLQQAKQAIDRQQALYKSGVTSKRNLQDQQMQWQTDKARLDATQYQDRAIADEALINWGGTLSKWALSNDLSGLKDFVSGRQTLLQITLPVDKQLAGDSPIIYVASSGNRSQAEKAEFISVAPQADVTAQGASYFFQASGKNIRPGMSVNAWIAEQNGNISGVMIPKSALIWSMNQAFVYIKINDEQFTRRTINDYSATADGYFISDTIKPGEQIVSTGGQMLLSEELRGQIPDEDD